MTNSNIKIILKTEKITSRFLLFIAILWLSPLVSFSQLLEIGGGLGASMYKGDLTPRMQLSYVRPAGQFFVRVNPTGTVAFRGSISLINLKGSSEYLKTEDFYMATYQNNKFTASVLEGNLLFEYNFFSYREEKFRRWSPYLVGGIGFFNVNRTSAVIEPDDKLRPINICIPFGVGFKYVLHRNWNIGAEAIARKTFTDFIDGVSDINPTTNWQRGNPFTNDWYFYTGINISYTIYTSPCPIDYMQER